MQLSFVEKLAEEVSKNDGENSKPKGDKPGAGDCGPRTQLLPTSATEAEKWDGAHDLPSGSRSGGPSCRL